MVYETMSYQYNWGKSTQILFYITIDPCFRPRKSYLTVLVGTQAFLLSIASFQAAKQNMT